MRAGTFPVLFPVIIGHGPAHVHWVSASVWPGAPQPCQRGAGPPAGTCSGWRST